MRRGLVLAAVLGLAVLSGCGGSAPEQQESRGIDPGKLVDLSYTYDERTIYWPTSPLFDRKQESFGMSEGGYWYASGTVTTSEHGGTHLDSPIHFGEGKWSTAEIPLERLVGPADVIDVSAACSADRDYRVQPADIEKWEAAHRKIASGDIVVVRTGWGKHWPNAAAYLGSDKRGDTSGLTFPGLTVEAARLLVERGVAGVGIDTASLDYGKTTDYPVHQVLNGANIYGLENLANAERLPEEGATLIALPMKIGGGSGGPVRVVAVLP